MQYNVILLEENNSFSTVFQVRDRLLECRWKKKHHGGKEELCNIN